MMKQKLSPVKYETAFAPPKINFRQKRKKKTSIFRTLCYLSYWDKFGPYHQHQLELLLACCQKSYAIAEPVSLLSLVCLVL